MHWTVYVDLDAYYVSCELRERPELVGKPVIVGPPPSAAPSRGVVLSASYEARAFGVHSAQPAAQAARLCPDAVWIPPDHAKYARVAQQVRALLGRFASELVPLSIDEAALGLDLESGDEARVVAEQVQAALRSELNLPASIGVATTRAVAKIATDRAKPGGVLVVSVGTEAAFLAPLAVRAIPGVGPKTEGVLHAAGITTIGELAARRPAELARHVGAFARDLVRLARGEGTDPVEESSGPRSRSTDRTFAQDVDRWEEIEPAVRELAADLALSLDKERLRYATVGVAFRWNDFTRSQRSRSLGAAHEGSGSIGVAAARLARELWEGERTGRRRAVRTLSVKTERLSERRQRQVSLDEFDRPSVPSS
jgi:nucleotidyltransferase/DNA polymerase involved in DNA repair